MRPMGGQGRLQNPKTSIRLDPAADPKPKSDPKIGVHLGISINLVHYTQLKICREWGNDGKWVRSSLGNDG